ncbi:MAG: BMC domain-containing protein [Treponemataceae bacterium]
MEFKSIARGIESTDTMMKKADVHLLRSSTICPGKYLIIVAGDVSSVQEFLQVGLKKGEPYVISHTLIPHIDSQVIHAIEGSTAPKKGSAVGILEYYAVVDAIVGADIAAKAAHIDIIEIRLGFAIGGKAFVSITGSVSEIEVAISAAKQESEKTGMLVETCVIPAIDPSVYEKLI